MDSTLRFDQEKRINQNLRGLKFFKGVDWEILDDFLKSEEGLPFPIDDIFEEQIFMI